MHPQFVVDLEVDRQDDFLNRGQDRVSVPSGDVVLQSQARVDGESSTLGGGNGPSLERVIGELMFNNSGVNIRADVI